MAKDKALLFDLAGSISYGRLSLLGKVLWPMLIIKSDDQGRGLAEADAIKWKVCPNVPELTIEQVDDILQEMASDRVDLLHLYTDKRGRKLYQLKRWWEPEVGSGATLQWARPSEYEAPEGWLDRIRYNPPGSQKPTTENWEGMGGFVPEIEPEQPLGEGGSRTEVPTLVATQAPTGMNRLDLTQLDSKEDSFGADAPPVTPEAPTNGASAAYQDIRLSWLELFPDKPKPRSDNRTLQGKVKTRMRSDHFKQHWRKALERAASSSFLKSEGWFDLAWFLKNDEHYEKCLNGNYDDRPEGSKRNRGPAPPGQAQSGPYKELEPWQ